MPMSGTVATARAQAAQRARRPRSLLALAALGLLAACSASAGAAATHRSGAEGNGPAPEVEAHTEPGAGHPPTDGPAHWSYEGDDGPEHWGELSADYEVCGTGAEQSPVNLDKGELTTLEDLAFAYTPSATSVVDNGHTIQVNLDHGGTMTLDGVEYTLAQFHFHAPSEHQMGGANYPMEVHLVHRNEAGELAVVGAFIQKGEAHEALAAVFEHLPEAGETVAGPADFDATVLLPDYRGTIRYAGSLTTPPCTEGVRWHVLVAPIQLSPEQVKAFTSRHPHSNRPVQPLGDRALSFDLDVAG
jgi:carbonic anhydrase